MKDAGYKLSKARTALLVDHPFFGALALRLEFVEDASEQTLAVDGRHIFYNPQFIMGLSESLTQSAIAHEVMHCVLEHTGRRGARDPHKWNVAADYAINPLLRAAGLEIGRDWLMESRFFDMSTEHIYSLLPDEPDEQRKPLDDVRQDAGGEDKDEQQNDWKVAVVQVAQAASQAGALPGALSRFLAPLLAPKVDWRAQLRHLVTERAKDDYTWSRPSRRIAGMPTLYSERMGDLVVVIDTSGSIDTPTLSAFISEIQSIRAAVSPQMTTLIYCDARINKVAEFLPEDELKAEPCGGGGTDFCPPFAWVEDKALAPACLVYLTDGHGPFPRSAPAYPTVWCMTTTVTPPWGECVRIDI